MVGLDEPTLDPRSDTGTSSRPMRLATVGAVVGLAVAALWVAGAPMVAVVLVVLGVGGSRGRCHAERKAARADRLLDAGAGRRHRASFEMS